MKLPHGGALLNDAWSVAGDPARSDVNAFFLQPFVNVNLPHHTFLVSSPDPQAVR